MTEENPDQCIHPRTSRVHQTIQLKGRPVRVERCGKCGQQTVSPEDLSRLLGRSRPGKESLTAGELALVILGLYPNKEVDSKILLMKEAFLVEKELARSIQLDLDNLRFIPHKYGPYSRDFDDAVRSLEKNGLINIHGETKGRQAITLTDEGKEHAEAVLKGLDQAQVSKLKRKRKGWDQLGHRGILQKVYDEYPAYKTRSEIADDVDPGSRWT